MNSLEHSRNLPFDIQGETLALLLATANELTLEQILFEPKSFYQRKARQDVLSITEGYSFRLEKKTIQIEVCREALYDTLPEGIFSQPQEHVEDALQYAKRLELIEEKARKFLLPYEQLFYWLRMENEANVFDLEGTLEHWWQEIFTIEDHSNQIYSFLTNDKLNDNQKELLIRALPYLPEMVGNWLLIEQFLSKLLGAHFKITPKSPVQYVLPGEICSHLGSADLGNDFILGNTYSDGLESIEIQITNLTPDNLANFLIGGDYRSILEKELLTLFIPIELNYEIITSLGHQSLEFNLGSKYESSILGYTTTLNN